MRVTWEESDIQVGRIFSKAEISEKWMIGYVQGDKRTEYTIISLIDGMVNPLLKTKQDVMEFLNRNEEMPIELLDSSWRKSKEQ